jgi:hypothetical protein
MTLDIISSMRSSDDFVVGSCGLYDIVGRNSDVFKSA